MDERHENGSNGSVSPVLVASEARPVERPSQAPALPAPVVAATGGALVAAAGYVLLRVLRRPARHGAVRIGRGRGRRRGALEISGSRSFLVDVHMLKR